MMDETYCLRVVSTTLLITCAILFVSVTTLAIRDAEQTVEIEHLTRTLDECYSTSYLD